MKGVKVEIVPDFYIGTTDILYKEQSNKDINSIEKFINLDKDLSFVGKWKEYTSPQHQQNIKFNEKSNFVNYLISITETIYNTISNDQTIFVCCSTCNQLSPLVAVVFLTRFGKLSLKDALRCVLSKLPQSPFQPNIEHLDIIKTLL